MHPNPAFAWDDEGEILDFVRERAFAHIFTWGPTGGHVAHAPLHVTKDGQVQFHLFVKNPVARHVEGQPVVVSVTDCDGYQSANWYESPDQVPTWHYQAVEIEGIARRRGENELVRLLDDFSATMEQRFSPANPWTRAKMSPGKFEALTKAITGFTVESPKFRGTRKFNQHKPEADIGANLRGQADAGRPDLAERIGRYWREHRAR
jgi:transcriptional regulator